LKLDFDLGNTRLKWHLQADAHSEYGAVAWDELDISSNALNKLQNTLSKLNADGIEATDVLVSSVASPKTEELFNHWLDEKLSVKAHYIQVEKQFCGLVAAYEDVSRLGVDRWLGMIAAKEMKPGFCIVIDAGSAITIDYLNASGQHRGGLIVPGLSLLCRSMSSGTYNLSPESLTLTQNWQPGCDTVSGISQGASAMYSGLVKEALSYYIKEAAKQSEKVNLFLSGGDAKAFLPWCEALLPPEYIVLKETLVLDGIECWRQHTLRG